MMENTKSKMVCNTVTSFLLERVNSKVIISYPVGYSKHNLHSLYLTFVFGHFV